MQLSEENQVSKLRVGVIGLGIGMQHMHGYAQNANCEPIVGCDWSEEKRAEARELFPSIQLTDEAADILQDPTIDVVSIASHDEDHFAQVCAAIESGKHVLIEKPICQTLGQLQEIKERWTRQQGRVKMMSNLVLRGAPLYRWLRGAIQENQFGKLYSFDADYLYGRLSKVVAGWRAETDDYSVMAGGGIHMVDLMLWLTGDRPTTVRTTGNKVVTANTPFRYDDFACATMRHESGMISRITSNYGCVHGHQHVVRVFGTDATLLYDDRGPRLQKQRDPAPQATNLEYDPLPVSKYVLFDDFIESILGYAPAPDTQLDFDAMSVCLASDISQQTQQEREIEYV